MNLLGPDDLKLVETKMLLKELVDRFNDSGIVISFFSDDPSEGDENWQFVTGGSLPQVNLAVDYAYKFIENTKYDMVSGIMDYPDGVGNDDFDD